MSQKAPLAGAQEEGRPQLHSHQGAETASLFNPITTPSCSVPGSHQSCSVSSKDSSHSTARRSATPALHSNPGHGSISPSLTVRTPHPSTRHSTIARISTPPPPFVFPKELSPSPATTPKPQVFSSLQTTPRDHGPNIPTEYPGGSPIHHHHHHRNFSRTSTRRSSVGHSHNGDGDVSSNLTPSLNISTLTNTTSLSEAVTQILSTQTSSSSACCHLCPSPGSCRHICSDPRSCCHVGPRSASRELRLGAQHHQVEPYARSRKADPQGYLFTCYLDYSRLIKPSPPACFDSYVQRPESLQYSSCNSACETPRSSTSSSSLLSTPGRVRLLYSRPPTPAPLIRAKEVHRIAMAGVPVDVKELASFYLFVAEIPGLKNTDVKVQVENDSILKISGERKREECEECDIKYIRAERQVGQFTRKFNLPANADLDNISAACQNGLLSVVVPKNPPREQHRPKNFEVKIAT